MHLPARRCAPPACFTPPPPPTCSLSPWDFRSQLSCQFFSNLFLMLWPGQVSSAHGTIRSADEICLTALALHMWGYLVTSVFITDLMRFLKAETMSISILHDNTASSTVSIVDAQKMLLEWMHKKKTKVHTLCETKLFSFLEELMQPCQPRL